MSSDIPLPSGKFLRRVKTPTMIQIEVSECGAVALGIVLGYYGKFVPLEELRLACGVSRNGSNAYSMIEGAKNYGMEAKGYSLGLNDLYEVNLPAILFWKFNHFVVLEGFGKDCVYINDPATGPRTITYDDLNQSFTGVAIILSEGPKFQKSGKRPNALNFLNKYLEKIKSPLLYSVLTGLCLVFPTLALPVFSQIFVDRVLIDQDLTWQGSLIVGLLLACLASGILTFLQGNILNRLQVALSVQLSQLSIWHMLRLPMLFYLQRYPGELATRIGLSESVSNILARQMTPLIINLFLAVIYGVAMFYYSFLIAFATTLLIAINLLIMSLVYRARTDAYARYRADYGRSQGYSLGGLQDIETIKGAGLEVRFFSRWAGYYTKAINTLQNVGKRDVLFSMLSQSTSGLATLILMGLGIWEIIHGQLTVGMFVALQFLQRSFMAPVLQIINFNQMLQLTTVDVLRIQDLVNYPVDSAFTQKPMKELGRKLSGSLHIDNIVFGYLPALPPIIKGFSCQLEPGKTVGIKGPTGSGKSTIAKMVAGLLTPWEGKILYDGLTKEEIPRFLFVGSIAFIEQEPFLFSESIRNNITLLDPQIPQEVVIQAAIDACIHDDIVSQMGGYDFHITEKGSNLSGGQRQRLEIARGLVKNPTIVILDEASSAIDAITETKIMKNLKRRGCAFLIISHRNSILKNCDELITI